MYLKLDVQVFSIQSYKRFFIPNAVKRRPEIRKVSEPLDSPAFAGMTKKNLNIE
jgi:hypothetical protein